MTVSFSENSEVSPVAVFVAVALTTIGSGICPSIGRELSHEKLLSSPLASVAAGSVSRRMAPSPWPEGSAPPVRKHWITKSWEALLFSVPETVVVPAEESLVAEVMTGKFWRLLAPVSGSSVSLAVTPLGSSVPPERSMPRPAFWKMELERTLLPVAPVPEMWTPSPSLPEMTLRAPAAVPRPRCRTRRSLRLPGYCPGRPSRRPWCL